MKSCCEANAPAHGCNCGRWCPVRAARDAGACMTTEQDFEYKVIDELYYSVVAMVVLICLYVGYGAGQWVIATYGTDIESFFWALAAKLS